jgi:hypothetical protein
MNTYKYQEAIVKRALEEQARDLERRMKSFIFTQAVRVEGGSEEVFKYINSLAGMIGASLKGFNGEEGKCRKGTPILEKLGKRIHCRENIPNFSFVGNRLKELKCFSYRDKGATKEHSSMMTTMFLYR